MAPKVKKRSENKQVLVIFLVFFILLTIGLGVTTYLGYSEQEKLSQAAKKATTEAADAAKLRDWYKFQSLLYLAYMGNLKADEQQDFATRMDQFNRGESLGGPDKERQDLKMLMTNVLDKQFKWDGTTKKFDRTYEQLLVDARKKEEELEGQKAQLAKEKAGAEQRAKVADDKLQTETENFKADIAKFSKKIENDNADLQKQKEDLIKETARLSAEKEALEKKVADEQKLAKAEQDRFKGIEKTLRDQLNNRIGELDQYKLKGADAPRDLRTDWRIVRIDPRGTTGYINLGSADRVNEQLTFSVHGVDHNGRPTPAAKGSVEVMNVVGDHLAQVRITNIRDPGRDPILRNDVLFNPVWNPHQKKHVAITGVVDLAGEGRDSMDELRRNLEKQNIVVDAWLDLKDMAIQGKGITVQTDYLVVGDGMEYIADNRSNEAFRLDLEKKINEMSAAAGKNGVPVISLRRFLEQIGYRVPKQTGAPKAYRPVVISSPDQGKDKEPAKDKEAKEKEPKDKKEPDEKKDM